MNKRLPGMLMEVLLSAEEGQRNSAGPFKRLEGMTVLQGNRRGSSGLSRLRYATSQKEYAIQSL
jgi:hypothetical protein